MFRNFINLNGTALATAGLTQWVLRASPNMSPMALAVGIAEAMTITEVALTGGFTLKNCPGALFTGFVAAMTSLYWVHLRQTASKVHDPTEAVDVSQPLDETSPDPPGTS